MRRQPILTFAFLVASALVARADVELPAVFGSHMVVQRDTDLVVWGFASAGESVSVEASWGGRVGPVAAGADGRFTLTLKTPAAGGPHTLTVRGKNTLVLDDVWSGEVWLCSGQSNMEMPIDAIATWYSGTRDREAELARGDVPALRLFEVPNQLAAAPQARCGGTWKLCNRDSLRTFSATGYYFGRALHDALGVPVGLIAADWGGTVCEAWTSAEALKAHGGFDDALTQVAARAAESANSTQALADARAAWWRAVEAREAGAGELSRARRSLDYKSWPTVDAPDGMKTVFEGFDGVVWLRRSIVVPGRMSSSGLVFEFGPIDDMDTFYFAGERIDGTEVPGQWNSPRRYVVPSKLVRAGRSEIALRVVDTGGSGGLIGKAEEMRIRSTDDSVTGTVSLAGPWSYFEGTPLAELPPWPAESSTDPNQPSVLFNAMIAPLAPFALRGAIWYQGESNRTRAKQYQTLFPAMIADWRSRFGRPDLPFYFVQIAPFRYGDSVGAAAEMRDAQRRCLGIANTGMAVTMDIGDLQDIHPKDKRSVGERLARWALARTYGQPGVVASGPLPTGVRREGSSMVVDFAFAEGLTAHGAALLGFELAGGDGKFEPADASIRGASVVVECKAVTDPVRVRFLWSDTAEATLFNGAGLPASPFELP
jgi:sialate O-acetylesterase